ncbi:DUF86 domain-containing protein [Roseofilum reptotaenium CS-1145]|uniref:DUF86 domain-containing protein n=1 Tax=Roseofilum reptotaenium AO1-A TaxID=1925591 RepID=A0A1L9QP88_9CYAN|nr:HepT-like ribonuclease domain-containing protein [Roseofilum reptotaenium]MDB9516408.1 DUF86 domain-containing protein [Roseofilum reptotaenium CS-1145]OJJ24407.1 hypothetical protein BI308_16480 [Roseofilum reptotaenium AO1-A]
MERDKQSILDIVDSIHLIFEYLQSTNWENFEQNTKDQDAVIRRLTIIGEATKRLSHEFRSRNPEIPWRKMAGLRDIIVHEYDDLKLDIIRQIIEVELPAVLQSLQPLLPPPPENQSND